MSRLEPPGNQSSKFRSHTLLFDSQRMFVVVRFQADGKFSSGRFEGSKIWS